MDIHVLGTRGEVKRTVRRHARRSGILINREILLDAGEEEFLEYRPRYIFITHLHPDHAFFVNNPGPIGIPTYVPEEPPELDELMGFGRARGSMQVDHHRVIAVPTVHSTRVRSVGYIVKNGTADIFYTGDLIRIEPQYHDLLTKFDLVITEASFARRGGLVRSDSKGRLFGHAGIPDLLAFFRGRTAKILFTHFGSWFLRDAEKGREQINKLGRTFGVEVDVAHDNMTILVNKTRKARLYS